MTKQFRDIKIKNEEGNLRKDPDQRVFEVTLQENAPQAVEAPVTVENYTLERINLLIANTQKDLTQIQARLDWAMKAKTAIENAVAEPEKKKDN